MKLIKVNKGNFKEWIEKAGVRAIKTVAQTAMGMIGTSVFISEVDWLGVASASILAGIVSILWNLSGIPEVPEIPEAEEGS